MIKQSLPCEWTREWNPRPLSQAEAPLDVWAILRNEVVYHLPLPPPSSSSDTSGPVTSSSSPSALYIDPTARIPQFKGIDVTVVKAMPLVVVAGLGGGDSQDDGGDERDGPDRSEKQGGGGDGRGGGGGGTEGNGGGVGGGGGGGNEIIADYKVKQWPRHLTRGETCVEVRLTFTRTKMHVEHVVAAE